MEGETRSAEGIYIGLPPLTQRTFQDIKHCASSALMSSAVLFRVNAFVGELVTIKLSGTALCLGVDKRCFCLRSLTMTRLLKKIISSCNPFQKYKGKSYEAVSNDGRERVLRSEKTRQNGGDERFTTAIVPLCNSLSQLRGCPNVLVILRAGLKLGFPPVTVLSLNYRAERRTTQKWTSQLL